VLEGFDHHYAVFRECARAAKRHFEAGNWLAIQHVAGDRIDFYDRRVQETADKIERAYRYAGEEGPDGERLWEEVKRDFIGLLIDHKQPECAETFFNSVSVKTLRRDYYHNRFIFVRPAISTEHIDADPPSYRSYYPLQQGLRNALIDIVLDFEFERRFADFGADLRNVLAAFRRRFPRPFRLEANHQIQVLSSAFFRNQTAYIVGRVVNGAHTYPFVIPVKHDAAGKLYFDALVMDDIDLALLFSANRAYFLVDMEVPSAYVDFLRAILPDKTGAELYTMVGLQKAGKNLFFRDFLHHLKHSRDKFIIAPGIKGLVMTVFTLPSYPYVFKVIRDKIAASKDTDRAKVKAKYWLVKHHDRVGRMTDILEYSGVAFPRDRFSAELLAELSDVAPVGSRDRPRSRGDRSPLHRAANDAAQPLPRAGRRNAAGACDARIRRRDSRARRGEHLRRRLPVQELRRHPLRPGRVLRLRRDRVPHRLQLPQDSRAPAGLGRDVRRRLVSGGAARRVSRGIQDVPAHRSAHARGLRALSCGPARCRLVAGSSGGASQRRAGRGAVLFRRDPLPEDARYGGLLRRVRAVLC
jgi:hypothetical protein